MNEVGNNAVSCTAFHKTSLCCEKFLRVGRSEFMIKVAQETTSCTGPIYAHLLLNLKNNNKILIKFWISDKVLKVSRSPNKIVEPVTSPKKGNEQVCFSILKTRKYLKLALQFQISSISKSSGIRMKKQIRPLLFFRNFLSRSTDL